MLRHNRLDDSKRLKSRVLEIPLPVHFTHFPNCIAEAPVLWDVFGFVLSAEQAAGNGVVDYDIEAVALAGWDELVF